MSPLAAGLPAHAWDASLTHPFWIFQWADAFSCEVALCSVVLFVSGVLCSAAGIGGGGVYVAVLMAIGGLTPHNAVPLSKAIVFFGSVSSLMVNLRRMRMPSAARVADKQVIDFDTCRVVIPGALFGTYMGVLLNWHTPDRTIIILLTAVLVFMTCMVLDTARKQYAQESEAMAAQVASKRVEEPCPQIEVEATGGRRKTPAALADECEAPALVSGSPPSSPKSEGDADEDCEDAELKPLLPQPEGSAPAPSMVGVAVTSSHALKAKRGILSPASQVSQADILASGLLMLLVVLGGILRFHMHACRDEKHGQGIVGSCRHPLMANLFHGKMEGWMADDFLSSLLPHLAMSLPLWSCVALAVYYGRQTHVVSGWKIDKIATYQATAAATGMLAGLVGVGGGLILSPFFLLTGMEPSVAVATSATCVLFTSSSTTIQYIFTDRIIMSLAFIYGPVTLMASWMGTSLVHHLQDNFSGRRSYVTMVVAAAVALSAVLSSAKFVRIMYHPNGFKF